MLIKNFINMIKNLIKMPIRDVLRKIEPIDEITVTLPTPEPTPPPTPRLRIVKGGEGYEGEMPNGEEVKRRLGMLQKRNEYSRNWMRENRMKMKERKEQMEKEVEELRIRVGEQRGALEQLLEENKILKMILRKHKITDPTED